MMYDEHGFYTREWASRNVGGFDDLDPCCQQLVLLFPDTPVDCAAAGLAGTVEAPPLFVLDPAAIAEPNLRKGALVPLAAVPFLGSDSGSPTPVPPVNVSASGTGLLLGVSLVVLTLSRRFLWTSSN